MKKLILLLFIPLVSFSQTPITNDNIRQAINMWINTPAVAEANYGHVSDWDTSNVTDMTNAFSNISPFDNSSFNEDISNWDVSNVTTMFWMFKYSEFNNNIENWDVSNVTDMYGMFMGSSFNQDISSWNVSNVTNMSFMFYGENCSFNQPIGNWDVSNVTNMTYMFYQNPVFNQNIGDWDVSNVTDMTAIFCQAISFNQPIGNWDVSNVTNEYYSNSSGGSNSMFWGATSFNRDLNNWDVSNFTDMSSMFYKAHSFNGNIGNWDVSNVTNMTYMFYEAYSFNKPIGNWDVSNVTESNGMFANAISFNQNLNNWDVSNWTHLNIFGGAVSFNSPLCSWDISGLQNGGGILLPTFFVYQSNETITPDFSIDNFDSTIINWVNYLLQNNLNIPTNIQVSTDTSYCHSSDWIQFLIDDYGWFFRDYSEGNTPISSDCSNAGTLNNAMECSTLNLNEEFLLNFEIYPNPTSNYIYTDPETELEVVVFDLLGKELLRDKINGRLDISSLEKGTYILNLTDGINTSTHKIIKE